MSISTTMILSSLVVALLLSSTVIQVQAQNWNNRDTPVTCSICRDASRPIFNPLYSFTMHNGNTWTCNYLQETVQDVDANFLHESERLMCAQAQLQGEMGGCLCSGGGGGAALAPIQSQVSNINPACDLCARQASAVVPASNYELAVTTDVVGAQNCQGLYDSLQEGIIDSELCAQVQQAAGATCCSSSSSGDSSSGFTTPRPITPTTSTTTTNDSTNNNSNNISFNTGGDDSTSSSVPVTPASPIIVPETPAAPVVLTVTPSPIVPETPAAPVVVPVTPAPIVLPVTVSTPSISTSTSTSTTGTSSVTTPINPQLPQYNTAGASGSGKERERIGEPTRDTNKDSRSGTIRGSATTTTLATEPLP
mmetsp:Transcript_603/g.726  ORF Transcript_603/g.726 Transcript_603/m.726 type:complete len:365 (+) Transcript_603:131-1225(+)